MKELLYRSSSLIFKEKSDKILKRFCREKKMKKLSTKEIQEKLNIIIEETDPFLLEVEKDERKSVQKLMQSWKKRLESQKKEQQKFEQMLSYEKDVWAKGIQYIAGIDEVGRGPLAGPVVAAAVILPKDFILYGVDDSKKLSEKKRNEYYNYIINNALTYGVGIVSNERIDEINIYEATKEAMIAAIKKLTIVPEHLLIDAMKLPIDIEQQSIIKGDANSISIACASIVAKVVRDQLMKEIHEIYPHYAFDKNAGYGTKDHLNGLEQKGYTPYHRKSFSPIKEMVEKEL